MRYFRAGDGSELAFEENGRGLPAVLFVHGWQANRCVWREVIEALGPDVHTIAVDLRGFGDSRKAPGPYRLERYASDLRELTDALDLPKVVLAGHSMGATVGLRFALDAPERIRKLVLIAPVPAGDGEYSEKGKAFLRATAGDPVAARTWLTRTFAGTPNEAQLDFVCAAAANAAPAAVLESLDSWTSADFADATRSISAPSLVIAPEHDNPQRVERKVAALLPDSRLVLLPDSGHYTILENPHAIGTMIKEFIGESSFDEACPERSRRAQDDMGLRRDDRA
jgi:pimeloyl-ACP methyl ester carboxylesterase